MERQKNNYFAALSVVSNLIKTCFCFFCYCFFFFFLFFFCFVLFYLVKTPSISMDSKVNAIMKFPCTCISGKGKNMKLS